jgi:hypothetical protein
MVATAKKKPAAKRAKFADLPFAQIDADLTYQLREAESDEHALDIAEAIKAKKPVGKVKIVVVDGLNKVVDGFHTLRGHRLVGSKLVPCVILPGEGHEAALLAAAGANNEHMGLKRTNADKRKAVIALLAGFPKKSDRWIGEAVGVAHTTVTRARAELESTGAMHQSPEREGKDGRTTRPTAGSRAPAPEPEPLDESWLEAVKGMGHEPAARVVEAVAAAGVQTAEDLVKALGRGETFGLPRGDVDGLRDAVKDLLAELEPEEEERPAGGKKKKVGKTAPSKFDLKEIKRRHGELLRLIDATANNNPGEKNGKDHRNVIKTLNDALNEIIVWHDRVVTI